MIKQALFLVVSVILMVGCSSKPSRYALEHDIEPEGQFDVTNIPLVEPKWEPLSRQGNQSSYRVNGKRYTVLSSDAEYFKEGLASWYGLKFHGELTSNGEVYDMYGFSAAHKRLPLPSYVKVTNLENGKELVVRVNDRGPFHSDRIIDLSYAAAIKLGFKDQGTARVKLERIVFDPPKTVKMEETPSSDISVEQNADRLAPFVQVAAFGGQDLAEATRRRAADLLAGYNVFIADAKKDNQLIYRVRVGPLQSSEDAEFVLKELRGAGLGNPQVITRSIKAPNS